MAPGGAADQSEPITRCNRRAPQSDARVLFESEWSRQAQNPALTGQHPVGPREGRRVARECDERGLAAQRGHRRRRVDLLWGQGVAVVVAQHVVLEISVGRHWAVDRIVSTEGRRP